MERKSVNKPYLVKNVSHQTEALNALFESMFSFYRTEDVVDKKFWLDYISTLSDLSTQSKTLYSDIVTRVFNQFDFNNDTLTFELFCLGLYNLHKVPKKISEEAIQNEELEPTSTISQDQSQPVKEKFSQDDSELDKEGPTQKLTNPSKTYGRMTFVKTVTLDDIQKSLHRYALLLDKDPQSLQFDTGLCRDQLIEKLINYMTSKTSDKNMREFLYQIEKIVEEMIQTPRLKSDILKIIMPRITKKISPELNAEKRSSFDKLTL